ncbi:MAG: RIP metalloprotease RseP [Candidatus Kapaibacterium sp.]|jgi:regulator of sigma E protease
MDFLVNAGYFILAIFPLVLIHEFGHFIAAKLTGTRADVFSIGMGPRLFGWNAVTGFSFGNLPDTWDGGGRTDYRVAAFPIGGYVRILGMVDESLDTSYEGKPVEPWEFRAKSTWQKMFMISAGVIMNILLAYGILVGINVVEGKTVTATRTIAYVSSGSTAEKIGFKAGDVVSSINGKDVSSYDDIMRRLYIDNLGTSATIRVQRGASTQDLTVASADIANSLEMKKPLGLYPEGSRTLILSVDGTKPAAKAGIATGDTVFSIGGEQIFSPEQFQQYVQSHKNVPLVFEVRRATGLATLTCTPDQTGRIGVGIQSVFSGKQETTAYTAGEALQAGFTEMVGYGRAFVNIVAMIIRGEASAKKSLGGPVAIAKSATQSAQSGWSTFLVFVSTLSITLAILNILPIPALDGGHIVFIIIEGIIGREVSIKIKMAFQQIGFILLLSLMAYVFYNDLINR